MADIDKLNIDSIIQRLLEGDIHGQYYDLLRLFEYGGFPPESNYLFLGDYVDRGKQSLETICLLLAYKIKYPENFFLLRGNHECASINRIYGFYDECKRRYNIKLWKTFTDCFNCLPIAAIVDEKIFCCHGGLSPDLQSMEQIRRIMRPTDVPDQGLLCDLLWSDPDKDVLGWGENDRGVSFTFGAEVVAKFLHKHDLDLICRAHQVTVLLVQLALILFFCPSGDIHGQYYDLLRLFEYGGFPPESNYLFLGDYVDRGKQSLETICLLLAYKIKYPENFFLLRGNHECASINRIYGFYDECKRRYNIKLWKTFTDCFNCLPIAAIVDEKIFCCHGGLSPDLQSMEQIRRIMRPTDVPDQGLLCDLLWSDPDKDVLGWGENDRGVSFTFGAEVVAKFLHKHDLDLICRAHQVVEDGYEFFAKRQLVTLFSAPNYCGEFDNAGAMMSVDETLMCSFQVVEDGYEFFAKRQLVTLFSAPNYCGEFDNAGAMMSVDETLMCSFQILKPAEKKKSNASRPVTPPRNMVTKQAKK
ncbi:UNVERIFIED_CONTAM: hypothetical protein FKN15_050211 [Acipenser sinensis]